MVLKPFSPCDWTIFRWSYTGECVSLLETLYKVIMCHYSVYEKLFNIKLAWVLRGMMDVFHVYCFKSVGIYKHKLSRIESLAILYWRINCISIISLHICDFSSKSNGSIYIPLRLYCYIYCKFKGLYEHQQETKIPFLAIFDNFSRSCQKST